MSKWIYRYIRADMEEIDIGPFKSEVEAQKARDEHSSMSTICTTPIEVADDYKLYKGEYE